MPPDPEPIPEPPGGWIIWNLEGKRALARFFIDGDKSDRSGDCQGAAYRSWGDLQKKNLVFRVFKPKLFKNNCRTFRDDHIIPKLREVGFINGIALA